MTNTTTPSASDSGLNLDHLEARIIELRTSLRRISETRFGYDGDCGVTSIADDALHADDELARRAAPVSAPIAGDALRQAIEACDGCMDETQVEPEDAAAWKIVRAALANQPAPTAAPVHRWDAANLRKACDDAAEALRKADWPLLANRLVSNVEAVLGNGSVAPTAAPEQVEPVNSVALNLEAQLRAVVAERDELKARLSQPSEAAPLEHAGWKWVPVEPTDAMCIAAREKIGTGSNIAGHIYTAMVAVAPSLPAAPPPRVIGGQSWSKEAEMDEGHIAAFAAPAPTVPAGDALELLTLVVGALAMHDLEEATRYAGKVRELKRAAHQPAQEPIITNEQWTRLDRVEAEANRLLAQVQPVQEQAK